MIRGRHLPVFLCIALGFLSARAAPVDYWFERGNAFYEQQAYDSAADYYEKIVSAGMHSGAVYYNLGDAYFRLNKLGPALLNFEKAHKLSPNDADISANIKFGQSAIVDRLPPQEQSFIESALGRLHNLLSLNAQLWVILSFLLGLSLLFAFGLFAGPNTRLWIIYLSSILIIIVTVCGISAGIKIYSSEKVHYAVVLSPTVDVKNQPNGSKVLFTVHEGIKFRIRNQLGEWSLVSLPTGVSGWVLTSSLGII